MQQHDHAGLDVLACMGQRCMAERDSRSDGCGDGLEDRLVMLRPDAVAVGVAAAREIASMCTSLEHGDRTTVHQRAVWPSGMLVVCDVLGLHGKS